jgi:predicted nuclease of predicted toxin-antitoxin system
VKILLDECVDRRLARDLAGHSVTTVPRHGWAGIKNGDLLALAAPAEQVVNFVESQGSSHLEIVPFARSS